MKKLDIILLKDIDIRKSEAKDDNYLNNYFLEIPAFKKLLTSKKYIVS